MASKDEETAAPPGVVELDKQELSDDDQKPNEEPVFKPGYQFWAVMVAICVTSLLAAFEISVLVTALPSIVADLDIGSDYVWIGNIFFLTSAAILPLLGQLCNIFGRRHVTLVIIALFTLGSGICGWATNGAMLIAGRAVQGMGSGGVNMMTGIIISDLVPLRERGYYIAIVLVVYGVGTALGPFLGGVIVEHTSWRWVFYINLPVGGVAMVLIYCFLRVNWNRTTSIADKLRQIDIVGNLILMGATVAVLLSLTWATTIYSWSAWQVITPLALGVAGMVLFLWFESSGIAPEPVMPPRLFAKPTSIILCATTFLYALTTFWVTFFLPIQFMTVFLSSPEIVGVQMLPVIIIGIPGSAVSAVVISRWGRYKPLHVIGFAASTLSFGLFSLLNKDSTTAEWVAVEVVAAIGLGMIVNTILPAFQAGLTEADQAAATATWSFVRSFGAIWGMAVPSAIFNNYTSLYAESIDDASVRGLLQQGDAFARASSAFVQSFEEPLRGEIINMYTQALSKVFIIGCAFAGLAFC